ncbi:hypothetical protein [Actinoplanes auranticolor]|uniref:Uncharacterized protein n=1 Tax=Actinoplanes auranticolor TaxID=47988 RepID=A0A919VL78_9ACTN|nr:hypothetical protein [Actinoplanes auranticolor]GIM67545.1 hypothetical protein Aau02nite_27740 [Actinoplanes auranticolor]
MVMVKAEESTDFAEIQLSHIREFRAHHPDGDRARVLVGTAAEIAERLYAHAAFREIDEVAFALPFTFSHDDYVQILTDIAGAPGPALGWHRA